MSHKILPTVSFQTATSSLVDIEECHLPLERIVKKVYKKSVANRPVTTTIKTLQPQRYTMDLNLKSKKVDRLVRSKANALPIQPNLVQAKDLQSSAAYKRFRDMTQKDRFRGTLLNHMHNQWIEMYGAGKAEMLQAQFKELISILDANGAAIFGELITKEAFQKLINHYNQILKTQGSKSWIHSYINLANHPDFLGNTNFNGAFLHPLLIAMISYRIGGPIRIVDARGKDAEPISVLAQDNMLHIDNTPFNDEYKIILTWEKDKPSGPKGQNFVFIPGTHQGARNCFVDKDGNAWSTENASIFITEEHIQQVFDFQKEVLPEASPMVIEASHHDKPLTTVFAAGSLVHHRYRTEEGFARSCMIMAYHRAADNPGQFIAPTHLDAVSTDDCDLNSFLFGKHGAGTEEQFLRALTSNAGEVATVMDKLKTGRDGAEVVAQEKRKLTQQELEKWKAVAIHAPTVEQLKIEKAFFPLGQELTQEEFVQLIHQMMVFDKHGPLDLILYSDSHEEIRKWARNQIREMRVDRLQSRIRKWAPMMASPTRHHLQSPEQLKAIADQLAVIATRDIKAHNRAILDPTEKISQEDAFRSVKQLLTDLGEAITRCESRQTFLSTSLFLFMACDTLCRMQGIASNEEARTLGVQLLANYVATGVLVEKQIQQKKS
ncbi:MAG: hypothetical protein ACD_17C00202G0002 [uncultured bacterium]|nr:MAG: hypothetical protein ACD_17C00202G0002 [uncultured bacterium]OGN55846.1 MAG: hypothetical protein A2796_07285 [Chlamydiae bacterium RIFCSPHIGHO2_01_FULL_44_39]OGN57300.1 MAG: hypothetical protein A3C42_03050 [Chlamydiae bacterium RIFCSPHIGHO2_02_FULL_45_9]OGN60795.1 MAG: hypothetical protein A3D96_00140 [Chlamydiae bacterium RIFCSPHIGHO2_12_FULL_44_59]OGN66671.1 MAG: hypothetical protein A2978_02775 [Chlamydiae bacterium RIFCSPLOWO2_01_FULL_44_52]OGN67321.1 MAG: hypothetical protein A3